MPEQTKRKPNNGIQLKYEIIRQLSGNALRVLQALLNYSDKDGWCFPTQGLIEDDLSLSHGTVSSSVKELETKEMISVVRKRGKHNVYRVLVGARYVTAYNKNDSQKKVSKNRTRPVQKLDAKEQTINYTQRDNHISNWEPEKKTLETLIATLGEAGAKAMISRFKSRCESREYAYADFDEGILTWLKEDRLKREAVAKKVEKKIAPKTTSAAKPSAQGPLVVPEDIQEVLVTARQEIATVDPQRRFMAALYWMATQYHDAKSVFDAWLSKLELRSVDAKEWRITAQNSYVASYVQNKYADIFRKACEKFDIPATSFT